MFGGLLIAEEYGYVNHVILTLLCGVNLYIYTLLPPVDASERNLPTYESYNWRYYISRPALGAIFHLSTP